MKKLFLTIIGSVLALGVLSGAQARVLGETLTKPVRSPSGDITEYAITFVVRDQRQRPIGNMHYQITLGTGLVVCGISRTDGLTQRVSSGAVQTMARIALLLDDCDQPPKGQDDAPGVETK